MRGSPRPTAGLQAWAADATTTTKKNTNIFATATYMRLISTTRALALATHIDHHNLGIQVVGQWLHSETNDERPFPRKKTG